MPGVPREALRDGARQAEADRGREEVRVLPPDPRAVAVVVSCDGAARGNPGPAGVGVLIATPEGEVLDRIALGIGETTNNVAEYTAALEGLRRARELGARDVLLRSDSHLLIEQLAGRYRVKAAHLKPLHAEVTGLARGFERIRFEHVPRERNKEADRLANVGVDAWLAGLD
ncbi:MAG: ribonuclease HI family protein [Actinobacteria bacterium]|nr:ribonuclease HI family protein [Actinomycetota bacterium]